MAGIVAVAVGNERVGDGVAVTVGGSGVTVGIAVGCVVGVNATRVGGVVRRETTGAAKVGMASVGIAGSAAKVGGGKVAVGFTMRAVGCVKTCWLASTGNKAAVALFCKGLASGRTTTAVTVAVRGAAAEDNF